MDYRVYRAINQFVFHHAWLGRDLATLENWAVPAVALATFALWLFARPGGNRKWKLASACALASAALALLVNQLIGTIWHRQRPFATHPPTPVCGARSHDPSFPPDHASAAFGLAFAVFPFARGAGAVFLAPASSGGAGPEYWRTSAGSVCGASGDVSATRATHPKTNCSGPPFV